MAFCLWPRRRPADWGDLARDCCGSGKLSRSGMSLSWSRRLLRNWQSSLDAVPKVISYLKWSGTLAFGCIINTTSSEIMETSSEIMETIPCWIVCLAVGYRTVMRSSRYGVVTQRRHAGVVSQWPSVLGTVFWLALLGDLWGNGRCEFGPGKAVSAALVIAPGQRFELAE